MAVGEMALAAILETMTLPAQNRMANNGYR